MRKVFFTFFAFFFCLAAYSQELQSKVFDKKGRLIQRNRVNFFGKLENDYYGIGIIRYEYDRKGNLIKKSYFDKDDRPFVPDSTEKELPEFPAYTLYEYDKEGLLLQISNHRANGNLMDLASAPAVKKFKYNDFNQLIEEYNFNVMGQLRGIGAVEVALVKYKYMRNKMTEKISYDVNKKILDFGLNVAQFGYDDNNRLIKISYYFANSELFLTDRLFYNSSGQLVKEEAYKKDGKLDYSLKYTYEAGKLVQRDYKYFNGTKKTEKHGIELDLPGWKMVNVPQILDVKDVDGIGAFLITVDKNGKIIDFKKSYGDNDLVYACMPFLRQIKLEKDEEATKVSHRGEIKVGILNSNPEVEEF